MLGQPVIYALTDSDVMNIRHQRIAAETQPFPSGGGLPIFAGQHVSAVITGKDEAAATVNLKLLLDGNDTYWVSNASIHSINQIGFAEGVIV